MGAWSKQKVNPSNINNGNEYEKGDRVSRQALNSIVNNSLYAADIAESAVLVNYEEIEPAGDVPLPYYTKQESTVIFNSKENKSNKILEVTPLSTHEEYPSAAAVFDLAKLDMLWENERANSSDDFNAQTVSVYNPKGYKGFLILFIQHSNSSQLNHFIATTGTAEGRLQDVGVDNTRGVRARVRGFSRTTNGNYEEFTFEDGKECFGASAPTTNNDAAKPWQIYGFYRDTSV